MNKIKIIVGNKEDIPTKYLEQLFALQQREEEEKWGILPSEIELFRKKWKVREVYWINQLRAVAINSEDLVVGFGNIGWHIKYENLDRGWFKAYIAKEHRRRGTGKSLLKALITNTPEKIKFIYAVGVLGSAGELFLRKIRKDKDLGIGSCSHIDECCTDTEFMELIGRLFQENKVLGILALISGAMLCFIFVSSIYSCFLTKEDTP